MARTIEEIQQDYSMAVSQLGQATYRKSIIEEDVEKCEYEIDKLQKKCKQLNNEAAKLQADKNAPSESAVAVEMPDAKTE